MRKACCSTLQLARINLDIVAMTVTRALWRSLLSTHAGRLRIYLHCDAPPQQSAEFFATTANIFAGVLSRRWLLPRAALVAEMMGARGKTLAIIFQVFLVAGPEFQRVRAFCGKVVPITTDMGTDMLVADPPDLLGALYDLVAPGVDIGPQPPQDWLFPVAVHMPGRRHAWDLLLQKNLGTLRCFPQWLANLKVVVNFLRYEGHRALTAAKRQRRSRRPPHAPLPSQLRGLETGHAVRFPSSAAANRGLFVGALRPISVREGQRPHWVVIDDGRASTGMASSCGTAPVGWSA